MQTQCFLSAKSFLLVFALCFSSVFLNAQIDIDGSGSADDLVNALISDGITINSVNLNCPDSSFGIFDAQADVGIGMSQGIVLTSGSIDEIPGPNSDGGISTDNGGLGDPFLTDISGFDTMNACVLEIDLVPCGDILSFNYVFGSDEYNEWACSNFNDIFAFLISGPNPDGTQYVNQNIALIPGTTLPVAINTVNVGQVGANGTAGPDCILDFSQYYVDNDAGQFNMEYDGFTVPLTAFASVVPGESYSLYLAVADAVDGSWDSGVFIEANSLAGQFIRIVTEQSANIPGVDNLVEGCIDGLITFEIAAPATEDIIVSYTLEGLAQNGVDYGDADGNALSGVAIIPVGSSSATLDVVVFSDGTAEGLEDIIIIIEEEDCAGDPVSMSISIQDGLELDACCDASITAGDTATLSVTGGGDYVWSPDDGTIDDINSANPTVSPSVTTVYTVTSTTGGCELQDTVTINVGGCDSDAGTVTGNDIVCAGGSIVATASDQVLDADDVLSYVLHNSSTGNVNDPDLVIYGADASGTFLNDGNIPTNEILYLSSAVGTDSGIGIPDLGDPCLSVSAPIAVVFLAPVTLIVQELCEGATGELSVQIGVTGGMPEYNQAGAYTVSGTSIAGTSIEFGTTITISLGTVGGQTYNFDANDAMGCSGQFLSGVVECIKNAVELTDFNVFEEAKSNRLVWATASETDNEFFTVQVSYDGTSFQDLGQIDGAGNSTTVNQYQFIDHDLRTGAHFYRIKQTDFSGLWSLSNLVMVFREEATTTPSDFALYPIPVQSELIIELPGTTANDFVSIVDLTGKIIQRTAVGANLNGVIRLNVEDLQAGLYFVVWENDLNTEVKRFVKE